MRALLTTAAALCALALGACGGGNDKKDAEGVVRDFAKATSESDGKKFCKELVTQEFLEQTTGAKGDGAQGSCVKQIDALKGVQIKVAKITKTEVDGDTATVDAQLESQGRKQPQRFRLKKEDGKFRLVANK